MVTQGQTASTGSFQFDTPGAKSEAATETPDLTPKGEHRLRCTLSYLLCPINKVARLQFCKLGDK